PERIERLARKHLKLGPARPTQIVTLDTVSDRDFDRSRLEPEASSAVPAAKSKPIEKPKVSIASAPAVDTAAPWPQAKIVRPVEASAQ
ncbi:MAG TPA: hypothetical protein VFY74_00640, partial [Methyloceanibacter sp.]|nr:hypothetical protein [Methyloceanibacter sp.]